MRGLVVLLLVAACGGSKPATRPDAPLPVVPERAPTGAEALLVLLPQGADAIAEVDLSRLRMNPAAGSVLDAVPRRAVMGFDPVRDVDVAVAAVYHLGGEGAATLFVLRGTGLAQARVLDATRVDETTIVIGPAALRERVVSGPRAVPDARFLALRAAAMPSRARGASVRVTAALTKDARVAAAGRLGVDEVPGTMSVWLDIADDAALVALLGGDDEASAKRLAAGVDVLRERLAIYLPRWLVNAITVEVHGGTVRLVWVVPPKRLESWARELREKILGGQS